MRFKELNRLIMIFLLIATIMESFSTVHQLEKIKLGWYFQFKLLLIK